MAIPEENLKKAVDLKNQGNAAFAAHDWPTAIDFYTKAIELNDQEPTFWSNRAQVRTTPSSLVCRPKWSRD
jgi:serine/threonine-protein phosphatase 5